MLRNNLKDVWETLNSKLFELNDIEINLVNLIIMILILVVTAFLLHFFRRFFLRPSKNIPIEYGRRYAIFQIIKYVVWVIAIGMALESIGLRLTWFIAGSAALLVGLGLGIQQIFNDIVSGILMLIEGSVKVDDVLEVDGIVCRVREIKLRTSKVITRDEIILIIPNRKFINENVINWSHQHQYTRFHVMVSVSFNEDVDRIKELLLECAAEHPDVTNLPAYAPRVWFIGMGDYRFDFELLFFSSNNFRIENTKSELRFAVIRKFRENGIRIPFPQHDLHWRDGEVVRVTSEPVDISGQPAKA